MSYKRRMRLARPVATAFVLLALGAASAGSAFAAGGAPDADRNGDGVFEDLAAQVAAAPAAARLNVIVTLDRPATDAAIAGLQQQVGTFSVGR